jgi:hypothetical protein
MACRPHELENGGRLHEIPASYGSALTGDGTKYLGTVYLIPQIAPKSRNWPS